MRKILTGVFMNKYFIALIILLAAFGGVFFLMSKTGEKWVASISPSSVNPLSSLDTTQAGDGEEVSQNQQAVQLGYDDTTSSEATTSFADETYTEEILKSYVGKSADELVAHFGKPWSERFEDKLDRTISFRIKYKTEYAIYDKVVYFYLVKDESGIWISHRYDVL
jgi:hypothetical protein